MKRLLSVVFAGACLVALAAPAYAQGDPDPMGLPRKPVRPVATQHAALVGGIGSGLGILAVSLIRRSKR